MEVFSSHVAREKERGRHVRAKRTEAAEDWVRDVRVPCTGIKNIPK